MDVDGLTGFIFSHINSLTTRRKEAIYPSTGHILEPNISSIFPKGNAEPELSETEVVKLHSWEQWENIMSNTKKIWLVQFTSKCGSLCDHYISVWNEASRKLNGKIRFAIVILSESPEFNKHYTVKSFPTVQVFEPSSGTSIGSDYVGEKTVEDLISLAESLPKELARKKEVLQLEDLTVWNSQCLSSKGSICVIMFLPKLKKMKARERKERIKELERVANTFGLEPIRYLWSEIGAQPELEKALDINEALSIRAVKQRNQTESMKTEINENNIKDFVEVIRMKKKPIWQELKLDTSKFNIVSRWDGTDGPKDKEGKIDL